MSRKSRWCARFDLQVVARGPLIQTMKGLLVPWAGRREGSGQGSFHRGSRGGPQGGRLWPRRGPPVPEREGGRDVSDVDLFSEMRCVSAQKSNFLGPLGGRKPLDAENGDLNQKKKSIVSFEP